MISNEYTFIKSQGASVVDYCLVPHEELEKFTDFKAHKITDLMNEIGIIETTEPGTSRPDHSILTWQSDIDTIYKIDVNLNNSKETEFIKFSRDISTDFLNGRLEEIRRLITNIETNMQNRTDAVEHYTHFVNLVRNEMYYKVNHKNIKIKNGDSNKKRRTKKPWWSEDLTVIWNELCRTGKTMLKSESSSKRTKREEFLDKENYFIGKPRKQRRKFWKMTSFWKEIGKTGIAQVRKKDIPFAVKLANGDISSKPEGVMQVWKQVLRTY